MTTTRMRLMVMSYPFRSSAGVDQQKRPPGWEASVKYGGVSLALHGPNPVQALILNNKDERCQQANDQDQVVLHRIEFPLSVRFRMLT